tara:strand:- start:480 stop:671 length:192 start_codon:yes stop_codon:yes gene_type:complete
MFFLNLFLFLVSFVVDVHLRRRRRRRRKRGKNVFSKEGKRERFLAFVKITFILRELGEVYRTE